MKRSLIGAVLIGSLALGACGGDDTDAGDAGDEAEAARPLGLDAGFGTGGIAAVPLSATDPDRVTAVALAPDGTIYTAGFQNVGGDQRLAVARIGTDGELDTTFGTGGVANHTVLAGVAESYQVGLQGSDYVMAGYGRGADAGEKVDLVAFRFTADGAWDPTFGTAGVTRVDVAGDDDRARDLEVLPDGRIMIVGSGKQTAAKVQPMVVLLDEDGAPVTDFGTGGRILSDFGGPADSWYGITLSEDEEQAYLVGYKGVDANSGGNDDAVVGRVNL